ncbi:MAG: hypothetical protein ABSG54_15575 [Terriglobia bacterium]|jgi:hypothetical protein
MGKGFSKEQVLKMLRDAVEAEAKHPPLVVPRNALKKLKKAEKLRKAKNKSSSKD